jgi:hypothetical protein
MAHVHSSCLADWRARSATPQRCEICRAPYRLGRTFLQKLSTAADVVGKATFAVIVGGVLVSALLVKIEAEEEAERQVRRRQQQRQEARLQERVQQVSVGAMVGIAMAAIKEVLARRP